MKTRKAMRILSLSLSLSLSLPASDFFKPFFGDRLCGKHGY